MWTKEHRTRQAAFERRRYPTDLSDEGGERFRPLLPGPARRGRKPGVDPREVLNAIRYLARAGCGWRVLPKDFPPWQTVYWWFRRFVRRLLFRTLHGLALMLDRDERTGRRASPTAGVLDSQIVKAPAAPADVQDARGAAWIIAAVRQCWPWLKHLFADGAYDRGRLMSRTAYRDFVVEVVCKLADQRGFCSSYARGGSSRGRSAGWCVGGGSCATTSDAVMSPRP